MFGLKPKSSYADKLTVQIHVVANSGIFTVAEKIWAENQRTLRRDAGTGKEFLHFAYANPKCVVWLQRDTGRHNVFELVAHWDKDDVYEVFTLLNAATPEGDTTRASQLLNSVLSTPSIVLSNGNA